jgi:hypothetical protein
VAIIAYVSFLYLRGDVSNYKPPQLSDVSSSERVQSDLQNISQAVEAYFIKNMEYPQKLELLNPEFLDRVSNDPLNGKPYLYTLSEIEGANRYRISVPDPTLYKAREFYIEGGKLVKN